MPLFFYCLASRYQLEDTKKAIVRLEQGARSYMQRHIASHGAFAVFYGRHLKHYIKKTEVCVPCIVSILLTPPGYLWSPYIGAHELFVISC